MKLLPASLLYFSLSSLFAAEFFVSPRGSDSGPGTRAKPFATLARARAAVRAAGPSSGATVWLRAGDYPIAETLELGAADSGSKDHPVVYRASPGEAVRLTGGVAVRGFHRFKGKILEADLRAQGITNFGALTRRGFGCPVHSAGLELFFRNRPMTLARWPNRGWAHIGPATPPKATEQFAYDSDRPTRWTHAPDAWVHGYWTYDWAESYERIASIDPAARTLRTQAPHSLYGYKPGQRWAAVNLLEELDEPGEWYLDRATGKLYFWPPQPVRKGEAVVSLLETPLVSTTDASHIQFRDLTFEYTRGDAVRIQGGADNRLSHCLLRNIGNRAVVIAGGSGHGVEDSEIAFTGDGAIELEGGDRRALTPAGHFADRNHIHHFGRWARTYTPAVHLVGVGNRVTGNTIHHSPHVAILLSGNDHLIEHNDIHTVAMETGDVGAFYLGRNWTERGNRVLANYFHNLGHGDVNAVYLDDCASGTLIAGNVVERAHRGVMIGGGRDNLVEANRFVSCDIAIHFDARGLGWAGFWFDGRDTTLFDALKAMPIHDEPWRTRYPRLLTLAADEPAVPKGNVLRANQSWAAGKWIDYYNKLTAKDITQIDNQVTADATSIEPEWVAGMGLKLRTAVIEARLEKLSPAEAKLTIANRGGSAESGAYDLWVDPAGSLTPTTVPFSLKPGEQQETRIQIGHTGPVRLGAEPRGEYFSPAGIMLK